MHDFIIYTTFMKEDDILLAANTSTVTIKHNFFDALSWIPQTPSIKHSILNVVVFRVTLETW